MKQLGLGRAALVASVLACAALVQAQTENLGRIDFPNSGAPAAQEPFLRGVLLLHSFEYQDARDAFLEAQKADPSFALAYWGEAMTYNHPLWHEQDREAARAALNHFAPTSDARLAKTPTERERGYLGALEALYGEGDKLSRDLAYSEAMRRLAQQHPDDLEAASFYALSILGTAQGERDFPTYMRAAAVAEEVFAKNPEHPGAIHYLIHSYDDPVHAPLGLRAARIYARVAPAASHAQHMISHIYVALGAWDEVAEANEKSFAVSETRARRKRLPIYTRNHHALHWLAYAYLQQGRYREARGQLEIMEQDAQLHASPGNLWYFAQMRAAYVVQARDRRDVPASLNTRTIGLAGAAADLFATALLALREDKPEFAREALQDLRARLKTEPSATGEETDTYAGSAPRDLTVARIIAQELEALLLWADGNREDAVARVKEAAAAEDKLSYQFGPPDVVKPTHELLGEMLLELDRPADARAEFKRALERAPRRTASLLGLARAARRAGDPEAARDTYAELQRILHRADPDLAELEEITRSLAQAADRQAEQARAPR